MSPRPSHFSGRRSGAKKAKGFLLTIVDGRLAGREYHFQSEAVLGRTENCDVVILDPGVSRKHARISGRRGVYIVEDLDSANGTRLNGEVIEGPEVLRDGDYVTVGTVNIMFSNLDLDLAGEKTEKMHLSPKRAAKLDHTQVREDLPLPRFKELLHGPRAIVVTVALVILLALPFITGRTAAPLLVLLLGGAAFGIAWWRARRLLALALSGPGPLAGALGAVLILGALGALFLPRKHGGSKQQEWSQIPIDYTDYEQHGYDTWGMGYVSKHQYPGDVNYRDKVTFAYFKASQKQRITLEYSACAISEKEVAILVNGKRIGYVPETQECKFDLSIELPPKLLKPGRNLITFDNLRNGPRGTEEWQISYVKFREEAIPPPSLAKAREHYRLGIELYDQKEVAPGNRQEALMHFRLARDYLEGLDKKPPLYEDATRMMRVIQRELSAKFKAATFEAKRLIRYRRYDEAVRVLKQTSLYFSADKKDPRYLQLRQYIEKLSQ